MGRADKAPSGTLAPADYPRWVLSFKGGFFPDDPVKNTARMIEHQQWRRDRAAWLLEAGVSWSQVEREKRRRDDAWVALHPEDRGPHLKARGGP
jgi:hypothetical protein